MAAAVLLAFAHAVVSALCGDDGTCDASEGGHGISLLQRASNVARPQFFSKERKIDQNPAFSGKGKGRSLLETSAPSLTAQGSNVASLQVVGKEGKIEQNSAFSGKGKGRSLLETSAPSLTAQGSKWQVYKSLVK